ncbi:MAG: hypothetical protein Q8920_15070 [Bacillota bacterium]|nr:hypothetical protein [Bacillota bacterium]
MKVKTIPVILVILSVLLTGCGKSANQSQQSTKTQQSTQSAKTNPDVTTTASIVNTGDAFVKAISKSGTWIIAVLNDLTINQDLVVEGDFKNTKTPPVSERKLALYAQDANRKVTARYTLTAPKMTIKSPDAQITNGTFKGDLYVSAKNFQLIGATVDGNVYFTTDEAKSTFKMDANSKITGKQELKK